FDFDGRVDHYLFAIDPPTLPGSDTLWETTTANQVTRSFRSDTLDAPPDPGAPKDTIGMRAFHVFVVKAVDNRGAVSAPVDRAFFSFTQAPTVQIDNARPSDQSRAYVTPAVLISWDGEDLDGV